MDFSHSAGGVCFAACPKLANTSPGVPAQRLLHFQCWASCPMMHYTQLFSGCPAPEAVAAQCWANCPFTLAGWGLAQAPDAVCVEGEAGAPRYAQPWPALPLSHAGIRTGALLQHCWHRAGQEPSCLNPPLREPGLRGVSSRGPGDSRRHQSPRQRREPLITLGLC